TGYTGRHATSSRSCKSLAARQARTAALETPPPFRDNTVHTSTTRANGGVRAGHSGGTVRPGATVRRPVRSGRRSEAAPRPAPLGGAAARRLGDAPRQRARGRAGTRQALPQPAG